MLLPQAMLGQTHFDSGIESSSKLKIKPYESHGWWKEIMYGGVIRTKSEDGKRTGSRYLTLRPSGSSLLRMDFVNGFCLGPDLTIGRVCRDYSRMELDVNMEWAFSRKAPMYSFEFRYILPPEYHAQLGLFTTRHTRDFDDDPLMDSEHQGTASSLFGWNGFKLYESRTIGAHGEYLPLNDLKVNGALWFETRNGVVNHRRNNIFGIKPKSNEVPMRGLMPIAFSEGTEKLWRADLTFCYQPGSSLYVYDDMHSSWRNHGPRLDFKMKTGWGRDSEDQVYVGNHPYGYGFDSPQLDDKVHLRFLSLEMNFRQCLGEKENRNRLEYMAAAGFFPISRCVSLPDLHHLDAAHFCWQNRMESGLTWFSLLTNYELSSYRPWAELHTEYMYRSNSFFAQYVQFHGATVERFCPHVELSYGWQLDTQLRIGACVGWDGSEFDGVGFNLILVPENK